jgi:ATP-dependent DNA helicase RecQ
MSDQLDRARAVLRERFGHDDFRPGQTEAIASVLDGRDTLVVLPTGGGKSLCYQVPALVLPQLTVVLSPLISLMKDQVDALTARGVPATFVNSTLSAGEISERLARVQRGEVKLLYVAPERFDLGNTAERLRAIGVSLLAVDEAHCVSEWGHDFRPSYLRIAQVRERLGWPHVVALTATATAHVREDVVQQLALESPNVVISGFDRQNLRYHVVPTRTEADKDDALVEVLREHEGLAIVYASTRRAVERIAQVLDRGRVPALAYHAGLDDAHRHDVQERFMREDVRAIVATNAFGMGIDKANVRLVVHHAMPGTLEAYYQEAGRAGRDGKPAGVFLLHAFQDRFTHEFFIKGSFPERTLVEEVYQLLLRAADPTGLVDLDAEELARRVRAKTNVREVEGALRILQQAGAYRADPEEGASVFVRLLATPARIKKELSAEPMEIGLLRALWRAAGDALDGGATVDLDGLPPGFGGVYGAMPVLESLERRQFLTWHRVGGGTRVATSRRGLDGFPVDWAAIDRRRRAELAKLDTMQQYAYTKGCRRSFILRYFGDPAARANCGGCDNCLGTHRAELRERPKLEARPGRKKQQASERRATHAARGVERFPVEDEVTLEAEDVALLGRLKALRTDIARAERVPAYVVFPDRTLHAMAARRPRTLASMADLPGVGPARLDKYGDRFLGVLRDGG